MSTICLTTQIFHGDAGFALVGTVILVLAGLLAPIAVLTSTNGVPRSVVVPAVSSCYGGRYQVPHLVIYSNGCQPNFVTSYYASPSDTWNGSGGYNFSFELPWIAEVNATGSIVASANLLNPTVASLTSIPVVGGQKIDFQTKANVTRTSGQWSPNSLLSWNSSGVKLGNVSATVVFHLLNATIKSSSNSSYSLKFDIGLSGWPWQSTKDRLGVAITSLSALGARFSYNQATATLTQSWNSTGVPISSLVFGSSATASTSTGVNKTAIVSQAVSASSPQATALLEFNTSASGYSALSYDPWIMFPGTNRGGQSWLNLLTPLLIVSMASAAVVSVFLWQFALRRRRTPIEHGLHFI